MNQIRCIKKIITGVIKKPLITTIPVRNHPQPSRKFYLRTYDMVLQNGSEHRRGHYGSTSTGNSTVLVREKCSSVRYRTVVLCDSGTTVPIGGNSKTTLAGLEPTRNYSNRFLVDRLNHSATVSLLKKESLNDCHDTYI